MKKLTKGSQAELDALRVRIAKTAEGVESAIEKFNETMSEAWDDVAAAVDEYNELIGEANEVRENLHEEMESWASDKSDRWQESDAGQAHADWRGQWEEEFETIDEVEKPDSIEVPEMTAAEAIENLPLECE